MASIKELLAEGEDRLAGLPAPRLEAEILLTHLTALSRAHLFAHPEAPVDAAIAEEYARLLGRRAQGEPVAYITGNREFWSLKLAITPAVLIPRPETELVVEAALERLTGNTTARVADLGTGSGAIALAIASERRDIEVHATDRSPEALEVARENANRLDLANVQFHLGSWCDPLCGAFDLIASNPPYVAAGDPHLQAGDLRFEPEGALIAGGDGMEALREIVACAPSRLKPGGWLILEHGHTQGAACHALLGKSGFHSVETLTDLAGSDRVTLGAFIKPLAG